MKTIYTEAAEAAGQWLIKNQISDKHDANCGRYLYCHNIKTKESTRSTNWQTGMAITALLWLYNYTKKREYLSSAELAAEYILSLQILDPDEPEYFGCFREETPQTGWMTTRDATSAAWGLLFLYKATGTQKYLMASRRFADWQLEYAWQNGWPVRNILLKPRYRRFSWVIQNNAQAGAAGYFMELSMVTGITEYAETAARKILDYYIKHFLEPSGFPHIFYDPISDNWDVDKPGKQSDGSFVPPGWFEMHRLNDDFAAIALLQGYQLLRNNDYLQAVKAYSEWVIKQQLKNGGFGNPEVEVAASCVPLFLMELQTVTGTADYDTTINTGLQRLLELQIHSNIKESNGAFLCLDKNCQSDPGNWVNIRNTSYSIISLIKACTISASPDSSVFGLSPDGALSQ